MNQLLEIGDEVKGLGVVKRTSPSFAWINDKRYAHKTLHKKGVIFRLSPNTKVDWTNKDEVSSYYETFKIWGTNIKNGDTKAKEIFEVKDNMIFHDGEYYLPWRYDDKPRLKDGYVWGFVIKKKNSWWELKDDEAETVNMFMYYKELSQEYIDNQKQKEENKEKLSDIEYLKTLDKRFINRVDLGLFKDNFLKMFDRSIFPYTTNGVTFKISKPFFSEEITVEHRYRSGRLKIDNSYTGPLPFGNDYGLLVTTNPYFTNECGYESTIRYNDITFDKVMLDKLASIIVNKWDIAIEKNARNWG